MGVPALFYVPKTVWDQPHSSQKTERPASANLWLSCALPRYWRAKSLTFQALLIREASTFLRNPKRTVQKETMLAKPFSDDLSKTKPIGSPENQNQWKQSVNKFNTNNSAEAEVYEIFNIQKGNKAGKTEFSKPKPSAEMREPRFGRRAVRPPRLPKSRRRRRRQR